MQVHSSLTMADLSKLVSDQWLTSCDSSCLMEKHRFIIDAMKSDMSNLDVSIAVKLTP